MGIIVRNLSSSGFSNVKFGRSRKINLPLLYDPSTDTGFYGTVPASELFTGQEISTALGLTAGILQNDNTDWLHFYVGKDAICNRDPQKRPYEIYIAKQTVRYNLQWNHINAAGAVTGKTVTDKSGKEYLCRIPTGADKNPSTHTYGTNCTQEAGLGSEWNSLMYRVSEKVPTCSNTLIGMEYNGGEYRNTRHGGAQVGDNWANYTYQELSMNHDVGGNGTATWCVETDGKDSSRRVTRGRTGVASFTTVPSTYTSAYYGFRPVLIVFPNS